MNDSPLQDKLAALRLAFDRAFAVAPVTSRAPTEDFLAIRVGPDPYAVLLAEVSGLYADRKVTILPSAIPELVGITGVRGAVVPVYDLRALFGYPLGEPSRWLMVAAGRTVGFAFDGFDGHLRFPKAERSSEEPGRAGPYTRGVLTTGDVSRPVLNVGSMLEAIQRRAQAARTQEE